MSKIKINGLQDTTVFVAKDLKYGEFCTFPKHNNNMLCQRLRSDQRYVCITRKNSFTANCKMLDILTGTIYCVDHWEPCVPVYVSINVNRAG
jgi:hypothetical protein